LIGLIGLRARLSLCIVGRGRPVGVGCRGRTIALLRGRLLLGGVARRLVLVALVLARRRAAAAIVLAGRSSL